MREKEPSKIIYIIKTCCFFTDLQDRKISGDRYCFKFVGSLHLLSQAATPHNLKDCTQRQWAYLPVTLPMLSLEPKAWGLNASFSKPEMLIG